MIGIDYNKANVDIRAMFSFTKKNATAAMERLKKIPGIQGCVILSTCNRMELWASTKADWNGTLLEELCKKWIQPSTGNILWSETRKKPWTICFI